MRDQPVFDRENTKSPFLDFIQKEFHQGRGTKLRARLSDKTTSHDFVQPLGIAVPKTLHYLENLDGLFEADLPPRFVLKYAHGWSARGVMILERTGKNSYFCHLSQMHRSLAGVIERQKKVADSFNGKNLWIVEQMVDSTIDGKLIPFDYKFYCYRGRVGFVVQIDRNVYPPKVTLLDKDFTPLRHKVDYILRSQNAQVGIPVVPLHAHALISWAQYLSSQTDSPFVSVDLYDSPGGPVFGEFTFSPGGTHRRMWVFNNEYIDRLDSLFELGREEMEGGHDQAIQAPMPDSLEMRISPDAYRVLAGSVLNGSIRAPNRLHDLSKPLAACDGPDVLRAWSEIGRLAKMRLINSYQDRKAFMRRNSIDL